MCSPKNDYFHNNTTTTIRPVPIYNKMHEITAMAEIKVWLFKCSRHGLVQAPAKRNIKKYFFSGFLSADIMEKF